MIFVNKKNRSIELNIMQTKSLIVTIIACCCVLIGCEQNPPDSQQIMCSGVLYTDPMSKTPIEDALVNPEIYWWTTSGTKLYIDGSGWSVPLKPAPSFYSESLDLHGIFGTDAHGAWGGEMYCHPTKLKLLVRYMGTDSTKHEFYTKEYDYKNELSWQNIEIFASDYE